MQLEIIIIDTVLFQYHFGRFSYPTGMKSEKTIAATNRCTRQTIPATEILVSTTGKEASWQILFGVSY
ncbi:MAG: hypothetical protein LBH01_02305 [Verrucomicrobiales bacterium]|jgi:hypothetical protein|nr:hypothetical protein [Verrucomicrobiales bacterium]